MAQSGTVIVVRSLSTRDFTGAIVQNAAAFANIPCPGMIKGPAPARVRSLMIISVENLAWEVQFFSTNGFQQPGNIDADGYLGVWAFAVADGIRIGATGHYYYYVDGQDVPIVDQSDQGALHVALVNRSAAAKTAGAAGAVVLKIGLEPTLGW